jgi:hypothetical protein
MDTNKFLSSIQMVLAIIFLAGRLYGQVNTEAMRKGGLVQGLQTNLGLDISMVAGNSTLLNGKGTLRFDYLRGTTHTFLVASRQQGQTDTLFTNKGFVHLRRTMALSERFNIEGFVQNEFNQFIRLKTRNLAGSGIRIRWLADDNGGVSPSGIQLHSGFGAMWEQERITDYKDPEDKQRDLIRSTNYLVFGWQPDERLSLQATTYFQFDLKRPKDFRVLFDGTLGFALSNKLKLTTKISSRYDSEPPSGLNLKAYDVELTSGLALIF